MTDSERLDGDVDRVMLDIETMGLEPGSAILSIGACRFDAHGIGETYYDEIDIDSCLEAGLEIDNDTREWWSDQPEQLVPDGDKPIGVSLVSFSQWLRSETFDEIWANSPSFDLAILETAYELTDYQVPWKFYETRDVRTVRSLPCAVELEMDGREHHALDDAVHQAREVAATLEVIEDVD